MSPRSTRRRTSPDFFSPVVVPEISCILSAKTPLGFDLHDFIAAAQRFVDERLAPVWGVSARLRVRKKTRPGCWALVFVDTEKEAQDDGWHDLTPAGMPMAKIFLSVLNDEIGHRDPAVHAKMFRNAVTATATHEIAEMLVDPGVTMCVQRIGYGMYSLEVADPVEEDGFYIDGFLMTDFVYPSWYESFHKPGSTKFDECHLLTRPFQLRKTGYASIFRNGRWTDHTGSPAKRRRFEAEDRAGHRTVQRSGGADLQKSVRRHQQ